MSGAGKKRKSATSASASASNSNASSDAESAAALKKAKKAAGANNSGKRGDDKETKVPVDDGYVPLTLTEIKSKISALGLKVPPVPPSGLDPTDSPSVRSWATSLQAVIEEFNLLLCCVSSATYKWGSDRSGAADQNLGVLSSELGNAQDQISSSVTPRLTNVLAPVVDLVIRKTVTTKPRPKANRPTTAAAAADGEEKGENGKDKEDDEEKKDDGEGEAEGEAEAAAGEAKADDDGDIDVGRAEMVVTETKTNHFTREQVDPDFIRLCNEILCRNARMLRQVVLANFHKIDRVIGDYEEATKKDAGHDGRGFAY